VIFDAQVGEKSLRIEVRGKDGGYRLTVDGRPLDVEVKEAGRGFLNLILEGRSYDVGLVRADTGITVVLDGVPHLAVVTEGSRGAAPARVQSGPSRLTAPMPGKIVRVLVKPGDEVQAQQPVLVMEAMKMENELRAPRAGQVRQVAVVEGQAVERGALLAVLE
jgi:biotin carboxyl carrier protein